MKLMEIDINLIEVKDRIREEMGDIKSLAESFKTEGMIQPLAVLEVGDKYMLLAGGRRLTAAKEAGITSIPVRIYDDSLSDLEVKSIELAENIHRKDLAWQEAIDLKKQIYDLQVAIHGEKTTSAESDTGTSRRQVSKMLGESVVNFASDLELAQIIEKVPQLKEAKTKSDAHKLLSKWKTNIINTERAKVVRQQKAKSGRDKQRQSIIDRYIVNDFFKGVKDIENGIVDLVEIDPPYGIDLNKVKKHEGELSLGTLEYNEVSSTEYPNFMKSVLRESYRVMKTDSWLIVWFGHDPWFEPMYQMITEAGFSCSRMVGIWTKGSGQTMQPNTYMANSLEMFFYARKGKPVLNKKGRINQFDFSPVSPTHKIHPTERPVSMMSELLEVFIPPGSTVMVPFLGSGNTILACDNKDMNGFGFDLGKEYKDRFTIKVHEQSLGMFQ